VEALAPQRRFDVGHDPGDRVRDLVLDAGHRRLGGPPLGALGSLTSPAISALTGGLITVAGAVVIGLAMPAFARYQRRAEREVTRAELVKPG
jgi:hypothetical protein